MIGDLYDANNVVVGQAALLVAPQYTPLPAFGLANLADPFDPAPFVKQTLTVAAASSYTIKVGTQTTSALATASTGAQIQAALEALSNVGVGGVVVTGSASPYTLSFDEAVLVKGVSVNATTGTASITAALWVPTGATDAGWSFGTNKSTQAINIEEQSTQVSTSMTSQAVSFDGALSEDTTATMKLAWNAIATSTAPATGVPGYDKLVLTDDILFYAVCLITQHFNGLPRWTYAPKCTQLSNSQVAFKRASAKRMYPVSFATVCKPSEIVTINFTAAGLP